jgi:septum site-determining protein MinC
LPVILEQKRGKEPQSEAPVAAPEPPAEAVAPPPQAPPPASDAPLQTVESRMITAPVRSGQRIYARNSDLIITAQVSAGAEVIADGCIHIYGSLRGRAIAGAQGDVAARIFCQDMQAEILAIAGRYKVADDIPEDIRGSSAQVRLDGEKLIIDRMN